MPSKYVRKTENREPDDDVVLKMLKAVRIDKKKPIAVSREYNVSKDSVYRLVAAFDKEMPKDEEMTDEKLKSFVRNQNKKGVKPTWKVNAIQFDQL